METIKAIGMSICVTLVVTSIFSMLMPDTKLDKVIKFSISLFFLTSLISPFITSDIKINVDIDDIVLESKSTNLSQASQTQFFSLAEKNIQSALIRYLQNEDINVRKIEVCINKIDNNNISISKLMVYINREQEETATRIKALVKREVGVTPDVIVE